MARRNSGRLTCLRPIHSLVELAALVALALGPASSHAARLSEVRVGTHEDHTRIVLQLDAAADYRMLSTGKDGELVVALDAQSVARRVASKSPLVRDVRVEPSAKGSTVHVALARPDVQVTEMILSNPPRIVFDLARGDAPAPVAEAVAPKPEPVPARTSDVAKPLAVAEARPAESPGAPLPAKSAVAAVAAPDATAVSPQAAHDERPAEPSPPAEPRLAEPAHPAEPASMPSAAPTAAPPAAQPPAMPTPAASLSRHPTPAPAGSESASHWLLGTLMSPTGLVVMGAGLLAGIAMLVMRRRAAADDDPLYSVMAAEDAGAEPDEEATAANLSRWEAREEATPERDAQAFEAEAEASYEDLALTRLGSPGTPSAGRSNGSIFEGDPSASAMAAAASSAAGAGAGPHAEVLRAAADVDSRIAELERRLEQLSEARERLERQVAAQTEELRVQRAAIARTQRVVRSMTKGEELATEPVPRSPNA